MSFILWTLWIVVISVVVNVLMESLWNRIGSFPSKPHDERGEVDLGAVAHRARHRG